MSKEQDRLLNMLKENKITEEDYQLLSSALRKKTSWMNSIFLNLLNPFRKVAGLKALVFGLLIILALSYLGFLARVYFPGILAYLPFSLIKNPKMEMNFYLLIYQNVISWIVLSTFFILSAKIFQQKGIRIIDFFGTVAFARFPYLFLALFLNFIRMIRPELIDIDITKGIQLHPSMMMNILNLGMSVCLIWQVITYFFALKESSGLSGQKLWISFIVSCILGDMITSFLTTIFL